MASLIKSVGFKKSFWVVYSRIDVIKNGILINDLHWVNVFLVAPESGTVSCDGMSSPGGRTELAAGKVVIRALSRLLELRDIEFIARPCQDTSVLISQLRERETYLQERI